MKVFIFTTGLNSWNSVLLNSLLIEKEVSIVGIYFSKPQGGDKGYISRIKRLLNYGVYNLIKIAIQQYFKKNYIDKSEIKRCRQMIKDIPTYDGDDFRFCLELAKSTADISTLIYFNRIIPNKFITNTNMINVHPSYLPYYKGVQPVFWALLNNEKEIGVTVHKVDSGIDTGPIYEQIRFTVFSNSIYDNMCRASRLIALKLPAILRSILNNEIEAVKQIEIKNTYYTRPTSSDVSLFFSRGKKYY
tara:strand:- start:466 stop:1203 length:738 start_codon:yes stop_codon:yes gene_type:complete